MAVVVDSPAPRDPEAYPSKEDLVRAGLLALFTGLVGFVVTYLVFVRAERKDLKIAGVDRRGAERPQPAAYKEHLGERATYHFPYAGAGSGFRERVSTPLKVEKPKRTAAVDRKPKEVPKPTPTSLPLPDPDYQAGKPVAIRKPQTIQEPAQNGTTRPEPKGYSEAWEGVRPNWGYLGSALHGGGEGVVVAEGEFLTTLTTFRATGGRGTLGGQPFSGSLVASDSDLDLALLSLSGPAATPVPLCPEGSLAGEILVCGDTNGQMLEVRSRGSVAPGIGFYGWTGSELGGAPLVNDRGELVALALPRSGWQGISWNLAISSAQIQSFLASRPRPGGSPPPPLEAWMTSWQSRVLPAPDRSGSLRSNAHIVPGQAIGNYPLGITAEILQKELGPGEALEKRGSYERRLYSAPRLTFTLVNGSAVAIETDYGFYSLESGQSVGSPLDVARVRAQTPASVTRDTRQFSSFCSAGLELISHQGVIQRIRVMVP